MSAKVSQAKRSAGAQGVVLALGSLVFVAVAFADAFKGLAAVWAGEHTYSHGFLTAPLILILVWRQRAYLVVERDAPIGLAAALLAGVAALVAVASLAAVSVAIDVLIPLIAWLVILGVVGRSAARSTLLPVGVLLFSVPIWGPLAAPLQRITAAASRTVIEVIGIPALLDGNRIEVPSGTFEIAGGCSGLNFFVVSVTIATLYGHLQAWPWRRRAVLLALAMLLAMVANWLRVIIVIVAASVTNMQTSLVKDHYAFGWGLFAGCLVLLLLIASRMDASVTLPPVEVRSSRPAARAALAGRIALAACLTLAGPAWAELVARMAPDPHSVRLVLPQRIGSWQGPSGFAGGWEPSFPGAAAAAIGAYQGPIGVVDLFRVVYTREARGRKVIGWDSRLEGTTGWFTVSDVPADSVLYRVGWPLRERLAMTPERQRWLIVYWYEVDGMRLADPRRVKLREGLRAFRGGGISALTAVATRCDDSCGSDDPRRTIGVFLRALPIAMTGTLPAG